MSRRDWAVQTQASEFAARGEYMLHSEPGPRDALSPDGQGAASFLQGVNATPSRGELHTRQSRRSGSVIILRDRLALIDWLEGQIWLWKDSGELCREFAERVVDHIIGPSDVPKADGEGGRAIG